MSISSPATPFSQLSQFAAKFEIRLGAADGSFPTESEWNNDLYPISMTRTASGRRDDVLSVAVKSPRSIIDNSLNNFLGRQLEVWAKDDQGQPTILIGWGFISGKPIVIDGSQEIYAFEARIGDEHFEDRLEKYPTWDTRDTEDEVELEVMRPLVFNPEIDAIIEANMSSKTDADHGWHYVLDPESIRANSAKTFQEQTATKWKLSDAVLAMCWWLNSGQSYITNPSQDDVTSAFSARNDLLKNVYIPIGASLPDALDILLTPLEYGWCLVHGVTKDRLRETKITFFQRGTGPAKQLSMQRPADFGQPATVRDIRKTTVAEFDALVSNASLANRVICYGEYQKREITVRLKPAWEEKYDNTRLSDLKEGADFNKDHPEVLRKWILDTAGDYIGFRADMTEPFTFGDLFGTDKKQLIMRRRFYRCLSQHIDADDKESNGYWVEWWNPHKPTSIDPDVKTDPGWTRMKWPFSVLEKECGIWFDGETPPLQLQQAFYNGNYATTHLRITATIIGDDRVKGDAVRRASSRNKLDVILALDVSDKFQDAKVDKSTEFGSIFKDDPTDARDDTAQIQDYAEQIRNIEDALKLDCTIPLEGALHPEYQIGDILQTIAGRNLSLKLTDNRYPQIVGIVHHFQKQQVELLIESFRKERPRVVLEDKRRLVVGTDPVVKSKNIRFVGRDQ